jgi:hypothetical protein
MNAGCEKCAATGNAEYAAIANDWDSTAPSAMVTLGIALQANDDFVDAVFGKPASRVMSSKFGARETHRLAIAAARKELTAYTRPYFLVADLIRLPHRALRAWNIATKGYRPIYRRTWMTKPITECGLQTGSARQPRQITAICMLCMNPKAALMRLTNMLQITSSDTRARKARLGCLFREYSYLTCVFLLTSGFLTEMVQYWTSRQ